MAETRPFEFKARTVTSGQTPALEVDVKNVAEAEWAGFLLIEFKLPAELAADPVRQAALDARANTEPPQNMSSLGGVVSAAAGWSVWAVNDPNDHIVVIRVFNGIDQQTGERSETTTALGAGATLNLRIPLAPAAALAQFILSYGYQTGSGKKTRFDGTLELTPTHLAEWNPQVSLKCDHASPTMIPPGREVKISWSVQNGVAATLRGPLPGGNSALTLSREQTSNYKIEEGALNIYAVGPATYVLDAEVKGPEGQPNVQVIRTLTLDIYSADKYASLIVRPNWVLPHGQVEIDWAVWGVEKASIKIGGRDGLDLELTEQNLSRTYQGSGTLLVHATKDKETETVSLTFTNDPEHIAGKDATIKAAVWMSLPKPAFTGKPVALAVADGNMALLTRDGLFTARIGRDDRELKTKLPAFVKSAAAGKAWHALAAFGREFVVLRQTEGNDAVLERYDGKAERIGLPVTLPADFQTLARRNGTNFDLVGFGNRAYVVAEAPAFGRAARSAYSVRLDPDVDVRPEGRLALLLNYRLVGLGNALYAFRRGSGRMLRFGLTAGGELDEPRKAASAVNTLGASMIRTGLLVPVGSVLAVLDPAALPSFEGLKIFGLGLQNVFDTALQKLNEARDTEEIPQDLSYNPQHNQWSACGHGLDIQAGAVAAYRGGVSKRLWVLQPDGTMHTLTSANEELFFPGYLDKLHPKELPPALDATREFTFANLTGFDLMPVDEVCRAAGLEGFSADGVAALTPLPSALPNVQRRNFSFTYSSTDTTEVKLRFMIANPPGPRYLLELTFKGAGLGSVNAVFKRLAVNGQLDEVPETLQTYRDGETNLVVKQPGRLHFKTKLFVINSTPHTLALSPPVGGDKVETSAEVVITPTTPDFQINVPGNENLGKLRVDIDYAMPLGCEMSAGGEPQRSLIRINTDYINMLDATTQPLNKYFTTVVRFNRYDGSQFGITPQTEDVFSCQVRVKSKLELDGVRIGDAVATRECKSIFVALARPEDVKKIRIMRIDTGSLDTSELAAETSGNVFSVPNAVAVSDNYYYAMFGETVYHQATHKFEFPFRITLEGFKEIVAFAASANGNVYYVSKQVEGSGEARRIIYNLWDLPFPNQVREQIPIQPTLYGNVIPTLAVSPDGRTAALCDSGGLTVVDVPSKTAQSFRPGNLRDPGHVVFSPDGRWMYCVHFSSSFSVNPRRIIPSGNITVTRVRVGNLNERQSVSLPNVEGSFSITGSTRTSFGVNVSYKEQVALTLAVSPDNRFLFVSAGSRIMKIATDSFTLHEWSTNTELPSRLVCVKQAGPSAYTVYALGSSYVGDGTKVDEYKTHLYFLPAPVN